MSLRTKVGAILVTLFALYGSLDYGVQRLVIMPSFAELERDEAKKDMERAVQAIEREIHHLSVSVLDWAAWDDTYEYVAGNNAAYEDDNLYFGALAALDIDLMHLYDTEGRLVWGKIYDLETEEELSLPEFPAVGLPANHPLVVHKTPDSGVQGIFMTTRGPMLLVSKPILTNNLEGPVRGALMMGRFLDQAGIDTLAEQAQVDLNIWPIQGLAAGDDAQALEAITAEAPVYLQEGEKNSLVYRSLGDISGAPALLLRVSVPRDITAHGESAVQYALISMLIAGLLVLLVLLIVLKKTVFDPATRLTNHAIAIGHNDNLTARLSMERSDEIGTLAREFDRMVERLADARKRLLDQSYQSGAAEMASGVLHNIGNALTPLTVQVSGLQQSLREAPLAEVDMALSELSQEAAPAERQADLEQFLGMASHELVSLVRKSTDELDAVSQQVQHIGKILSDQEKFSRAKRVLEPTQLDDLVNESVQVVDEDLRKSLSVVLDDSVATIGPVPVARTALVQVFTNLVINAAESIRESGTEQGSLQVSADEAFIDGVAMVHLRFQDNGVGIATDHLTQIFERGFSTKDRGSSGLGLHWSANTLAALNSKLYAESEGAGEGACMHVLLPKAAQAAAPVSERAA